MSDVECVWPVGAILGEGPCWSATDRAVWFVDIKRRRLWHYDPATAEALINAFVARGIATYWILGSALGALFYVVPRASGNPLASGGMAMLGGGQIDGLRTNRHFPAARRGAAAVGAVGGVVGA